MLKHLWNLGFQKRGQKEKYTVYYYQYLKILKPNNSSVNRLKLMFMDVSVKVRAAL